MRKIIIRKEAEAPIITMEIGATSDDMYDAIRNGLDGAYLEHINLKVDGVWIDIWLDEEGKLKRLPFNLKVPGPETLVGPLVFTGGADEEGKTLGLNPEQERAALSLLHGTAQEVEWPRIDPDFLAEFGFTVIT